MQILDLSLPDPAENLALDEALLEGAENARTGELLRWWESPTPFVVLGAGCPASTEVNHDACSTHNVPVLRRCSGGGTVVQGPGCINYTFVLDREARPELANIDGTNHYVLQRLLIALKECGVEAQVRGISDLASGGLKFSGNAQRRRKRWVLFHGTILYSFHLSHISQCLAEPAKQPDYRGGRPHEAFVQNVSVQSSELKAAVARQFDATRALGEWPEQRVRQLVQEKYGQHSWNYGL